MNNSNTCNLPVARDATVNTLLSEFDRLYVQDQTRDTLLSKFAARADFGFKKYGQTTHDRTDISQRGWFTHLQEEVMDSCVYTVRILRDLPKDSPSHHQLYSYLRTLMEMAMLLTDNIRILSDLEAADHVG